MKVDVEIEELNIEGETYIQRGRQRMDMLRAMERAMYREHHCDHSSANRSVAVPECVLAIG